jgi:hypothetical protein
MEVIYAKGRPGQLDFYITERRENVPDDAVIFAVCTETHVIENTDEDLFDAITDQEYFTAQEMIYEATRREALRCQAERQAAPFLLEISVSHFFRWLTNTQTVGHTSSLQKNPSNC